MNCNLLETHSATSSESYDEQYCACKPQCSILILILILISLSFLAIIVFFTNTIDMRFGVYTSACTTSETI
jgi:hypothetical protein